MRKKRPESADGAKAFDKCIADIEASTDAPTLVSLKDFIARASANGDNSDKHEERKAMRSIVQSVKFMIIAVVLGLMPGIASPAAAKPLKVFILAGQSNMQGHVNVSTFDSMADDPKTAPILKEMRNADGTPRVCEKVWISSIGCAGDDTTEQKGKLTAGFGASPEEIGPEFTFGIYMEKLLGEPILIIKTSWGGKDLHTDFRPPSAGPFVWSDFEFNARKKRGDDMEKDKAEKIKATGVYYRLMIEHVRKVLGGHQAGGAGLRSEAGLRIGRFRLVPGVQRSGHRLDV